MAERLMLTFAEIEFALRAGPAQADAVRSRLRLNPEAASDIVVAAGVSSLLVRGLATMPDDDLGSLDVIPGATLVGVIAALSTARVLTEAAGWLPDRPAVLHVFSGPMVRLLLSPGAYGQFSAELADPAEPLVDVLGRFLDACSVGDRESAVVIRSTEDGNEIEVAIARDGSGTWRISDSVANPDSSLPTTRPGITARLDQLLRAQPAAAV
jgi:hypothetical protein